MNLKEYEKVCNYNYLQYCDYLQEKYGLSTGNYFSRNWGKNAKITRTKEGLYIHHKYEDHAIMLGDAEYAKNNPYEWQEAKNLVYCDLLEHLFLHILICENPSPERNLLEAVGIGGIINHIVPELNDLYSGWKTNQTWRLTCHNMVINDKDIYLLLIKRFKNNCKNYPLYDEKKIYRSLNEIQMSGLWNANKDKKIIEELKIL